MKRYAAPLLLLVAAVLLVTGKLPSLQWNLFPSVAPIQEPGFRVLMVYESADLSQLSEAQKSVLYSTKIRQYLNAKCSKGADGKTPDYRIIDQDTDVSGDANWWQEAMKRERKSLPWLVISNGKTGFEGPLPKSVDEALAVLKKYGG
jgi:hypothetical protein